MRLHRRGRTEAGGRQRQPHLVGKRLVILSDSRQASGGIGAPWNGVGGKTIKALAPASRSCRPSLSASVVGCAISPATTGMRPSSTSEGDTRHGFSLRGRQSMALTGVCVDHRAMHRLVCQPLEVGPQSSFIQTAVLRERRDDGSQDPAKLELCHVARHTPLALSGRMLRGRRATAGDGTVDVRGHPAPGEGSVPLQKGLINASVLSVQLAAVARCDPAG